MAYHYRIVSQYILFQGGSVKCPADGCNKEFPTKGALVPHYGVEHKAVFRHYNRIMGFMGKSMVNNLPSWMFVKIIREGGEIGIKTILILPKIFLICWLWELLLHVDWVVQTFL